MSAETLAKIKEIEAELSLLGPDYSVTQRDGYEYPCFEIVHLPTGTEAIYRSFYNENTIVPIFKGDSKNYDHCRKDDPEHVASVNTKARGKNLVRKIKDVIERTIAYQRNTLDARIAAWDAVYQRERDADVYVNRHLGANFSDAGYVNRTEYIKVGTERHRAERRGGGKFSLDLRDISPETLVAVVQFLQRGNRPGLCLHYIADKGSARFPYQDEIESLALHTGRDNHAIYAEGLTLNLKYDDEKKGWVHHENA